jgi:hypothetical protein
MLINSFSSFIRRLERGGATFAERQVLSSCAFRVAILVRIVVSFRVKGELNARDTTGAGHLISDFCRRINRSPGAGERSGIDVGV